MAEVVQLAKPDVKASVPGGFVMTESARDILRTLQLIGSRADGEIALVSAVPGTGKTEVIWHFKHEFKPEARLFTAIAREDDTPWGAACQLMELLDIGRPNNRDMRSSRKRIADAIGVENVLIVDEAQNLIRHNLRGGTDWSTFDWMRQMASEGYFSIVFCGDLALLGMKERLPQLWRRVSENRPIIIKSVPKGDVAAFSASRGIDDPKIVDVLYQVSRHCGGLGTVSGAVHHARLLAGGNQPSPAHIIAALEDLKLIPGKMMGGK